MMRHLATWLPTQWAVLGMAHIVLMPIAWLFGFCVCIRKLLYRIGFLNSTALPVPVIIVGNINVGGTGKTPLVIYLVEQLRKCGFSPGVISRGFGGEHADVHAIQQHDDASEVGDEPKLIANRTQCPVYIGQHRVQAGEALLADHPECDVIVCDDGLQHYRLQRTIEIVVVDGSVGFGNGALLPAGPLRESIARLNEVDAIVVNGEWRNQLNLAALRHTPNYQMHLKSGVFYPLSNPSAPFGDQQFSGKTITAIAGIGNPKRFFEQLTYMGLTFEAKPFPDHHRYVASDLNAITTDIIIMTEKDAVKCQALMDSRCWVLPVDVDLDNRLIDGIVKQLAL